MKTTTYTECHACHARIVWPVDIAGTRMAPLNWAPASDPYGTVAVWHEADGTWRARVIGQGDPPVTAPEKRFRWHRETCTPRTGEHGT